MKFSLLLSLSIFSLTFTQNIPTTFSCQSTTPNQASDCLAQPTNTGNICCFISSIQSSDKKCISIASSFLNGQESYFYNNQNYLITCPGNTWQKTILGKCGTGTEIKTSECAVSSSFVNSCCYNADTSNGLEGCYWLGSKYSGTANWGGLNLDCAGNFVSFSFSLIFIILMIVF